MAINGPISNTTFTDIITTGSTIIKATHLNELSAAIVTLQNLKANVNNCDCAVCTDNCCQTCQSKTCQSKTCQKSGGCSDCCGH